MDIIIDITDTILETDRLILRPWYKSDLDDFYEYASVIGVGEMAGWKHHESKEITKKILDSFIEGKNTFAIVYKENNKVIGSIGFHKSWANDELEYKDLKLKEIGYVLSKKYWGRGLTVEAIKKIIHFCFYEYNLDALTVEHFSINKQSKRVIEKCGFEFVKQGETVAKQLEKSFTNRKYILKRISLKQQ